MDEYICKYCGKKVKTLNGLKHHEPYCKLNPNKKQHHDTSPESNKKKSHVAWNKGLTKETNETIRLYGEKISNNYKTGKIKHHHTKHSTDTKIKLSNIRKEYLKNNPNPIKSCGRAKKYNYKNVVLDGTWEVIFATYLDSLNIVWERPKNYFEYEYNGTHMYYPDFFLKDYNIYVEVKGYETDLDRIKWNAIKDIHKQKLLVIKKYEIDNIKKGLYNIFNHI